MQNEKRDIILIKSIIDTFNKFSTDRTGIPYTCFYWSSTVSFMWLDNRQICKLTSSQIGWLSSISYIFVSVMFYYINEYSLPFCEIMH